MLWDHLRVTNEKSVEQNKFSKNYFHLSFPPIFLNVTNFHKLKNIMLNVIIMKFSEHMQNLLQIPVFWFLLFHLFRESQFITRYIWILEMATQQQQKTTTTTKQTNKRNQTNKQKKGNKHCGSKQSWNFYCDFCSMNIFINDWGNVFFN